MLARLPASLFHSVPAITNHMQVVFEHHIRSITTPMTAIIASHNTKYTVIFTLLNQLDKLNYAQSRATTAQ